MPYVDEWIGQPLSPCATGFESQSTPSTLSKILRLEVKLCFSEEWEKNSNKPKEAGIIPYLKINLSYY